MKKRYFIFMLFLIVISFLLGSKIYQEIIFIRSDKIIDSILKENIIEPNMEKITDTEEIAEEPKISTIKLLAAGDIMFHSPQFRAAYDNKNGGYDFTPTFKHIKKYVQNADMALANFETVTAGKDIEFQGFPRFNTPKESLLAIKDTGFDILSTANNHSLDQGKRGLVNTIDAIEEYGLKNIGTYKEPNSRIHTEEINEIKIAFLSYTYGMNGMDFSLTTEELDYMINKIDEDRIREDIKESKKLGVDMIVVSIHWGNEYHRDPSQYQIDLGRKMVDWGANIILGSHPHVIQKSEMVNKDGKDNFIIYSMGNFLSNQRNKTMNNKYTEDGIMIQLEIEKDFLKGDTIIKNIYYIPTWVHRYRSDGRLFYEILPIKDVLEGSTKTNQLDKIKLRLEESYRDSMEKMIQY